MNALTHIRLHNGVLVCAFYACKCPRDHFIIIRKKILNQILLAFFLDRGTSETLLTCLFSFSFFILHFFRIVYSATAKASIESIFTRWWHIKLHAFESSETAQFMSNKLQPWLKSRDECAAECRGAPEHESTGAHGLWQMRLWHNRLRAYTLILSTDTSGAQRIINNSFRYVLSILFSFAGSRFMVFSSCLLHAGRYECILLRICLEFSNRNGFV